MENQETDDATEPIAGLFGRRASKSRRSALPPRLGRPRRRIEGPRYNTNILLYKRYGKHGLDAYVAHEQRELIGGAGVGDVVDDDAQLIV